MRVISRDQMIAKLKKAYPSLFISTTEEFNGSEGGIWLSGEDGTTDRNGNVLFNYWSEDHTNRTFGVINHLNNFVERNGWFFEWNDAGTIMLWLA